MCVKSESSAPLNIKLKLIPVTFPLYPQNKGSNLIQYIIRNRISASQVSNKEQLSKTWAFPEKWSVQPKTNPNSICWIWDLRMHNHNVSFHGQSAQIFKYRIG